MKEYKIEFENGVVVEATKKITRFENIVMCGCGGKDFELTAHYDFNDRYIGVLVCKCGNHIMVTTPRKNDDFWNDEEVEE